MHTTPILAAGLAAGTLMAAPAMAAPISIDSPGGDTGASSFTWQGLDFTLSDQPGSAVNAEHRVTGDSDGEIDFFLEEPGTVSYRAELPSTPNTATSYNLGFRYGEDLSTVTSGFSDLNALFRHISGGTEIAQQLLAGSSATNTNSPFYGTTGRTAAGGGLSNQTFLNNVGYGTEGMFEMLVSPDGTAQTSVTAAGVSGSADFSTDLTPGGSPSPFFFDEVFLQVESFQDSSDFSNQFGTTGQEFTFTSANVSPVPLPATLPLMLGALGLGGVAVRRRRRAG